ncbi:uncharacterized protein EI90DRAFT_2059527 [Cantharellus anzutake]|uniref:uncharacterized protein n=1 Tax=Cantharellus anzutake TaxID=1750568 RepID=UPI001908D276|nr:uncharacterized protein EI90DRAFT_2059527 [Cantharellus anzutake]KAF8340399.1 hypothetical protein EI90DRAFT_2059527 [Cantharellus anzutake]
MEASLERNISNPHRGSRDKRSRDGCIICRLRKKNCSGPLVAESITCQECIALNVICLGFPGQRPKGMQKNKEKVKELKEKIKDWTSKRSNRNHGVEPLNLSEYSFLVSHASDISGPSSAAPASVNSDFGGLRTSISQEFMHPIATPEAFSHAESSFGSPGLHRSLSDASRPHRPALRLDPVFQQSAGARPAPYPQQGINNHNETNSLLSPHSGVHRHQRSRSLSSMPRVHLFDNQPENIPQFQLTHQRGTASMDSRQHTLHPGSCKCSVQATYVSLLADNCDFSWHLPYLSGQLDTFTHPSTACVTCRGSEWFYERVSSLAFSLKRAQLSIVVSLHVR